MSGEQHKSTDENERMDNHLKRTLTMQKDMQKLDFQMSKVIKELSLLKRK